MAAVALNIAQAKPTGDAINAQAATAVDGFTVRPGGRYNAAVLIFNDSGASVTATVTVPGSFLGQAIPDVPVAVPAGGWRAIKLDPAFVDPDTGLVTIALSAFASVTAALVQVA